MNVSSSIAPSTGERLIGIRALIQWIDIDWRRVEEHVNRLQARITKAVKLLPEYGKGYEMRSVHGVKVSRTVLR